jgi:hypothetical protein
MVRFYEDYRSLSSRIGIFFEVVPWLRTTYYSRHERKNETQRPSDLPKDATNCCWSWGMFLSSSIIFGISNCSCPCWESVKVSMWKEWSLRDSLVWIGAWWPLWRLLRLGFGPESPKSWFLFVKSSVGVDQRALHESYQLTDHCYRKRWPTICLILHLAPLGDLSGVFGVSYESLDGFGSRRTALSVRESKNLWNISC